MECTLTGKYRRRAAALAGEVLEKCAVHAFPVSSSTSRLAARRPSLFFSFANARARARMYPRRAVLSLSFSYCTMSVYVSYLSLLFVAMFLDDNRFFFLSVYHFVL